MAALEVRSELPGVWSAVEVTVEGEGRSDKHAVDIVVPEGSEWLIVALTGTGPAGFLAPPTQAEFALVDAQGNHHTETFQRAAGGQLTAVVRDPLPGRWTITLFYGETGSADMNVGVLSRALPTKMQKFGRWIRCTSCKLGTKAAIIALLAHLLPLLAAGLGVQQALMKLAAAGAKVLTAALGALGLTVEALGKVLETLKDYVDDPIDSIMERLCSMVGLCAS